MLLRAVLKAWLLPPGGFLFGFGLAFILLLIGSGEGAFKRGFRRFGFGILLLSSLGLYLSSTPFLAAFLSGSIEQYPALDLARVERLAAEGESPAIVILGAGHLSNAKEFQAYSEFGLMTVDKFALERLRYGAFLQRQTGLPVLVTGGGDGHWSQAALMAESLQRDFQVPVNWLEARSRTTWENARYSRQILKAENIGRVILVTHAFHMRRAVYAFQQQGFQVLPAPTAYGQRQFGGLGNWLPSVAAMHEVRRVLHEYLGLWVYRYLSPELDPVRPSERSA